MSIIQQSTEVIQALIPLLVYQAEEASWIKAQIGKHNCMNRQL